MKKKFLSLLLVCTMTMGLFPAQTIAEETAPALKISGNTALTPLTEVEIAELSVEAPLSLPETVFETAPSLQDPHAAGKLTAEALDATLARLNYLRRLAGLPAVQLNDELNDSAQHGAVLLTNVPFSHQPKKPDNMSQEFYDKGYASLSAGNLAGGVTLTQAVDLFMDDSDAVKDGEGHADEANSNLAKLGHRRWQLSPLLGKIGFGYAYDDPADDPVQEEPTQEEESSPAPETQEEEPGTEPSTEELENNEPATEEPENGENNDPAGEDPENNDPAGEDPEKNGPAAEDPENNAPAGEDPEDDPNSEDPPEETEPETPKFNYRHYVVEQVFDSSAEYFDYEFIAWPASGSFPNNVFNAGSAWSITLNEEKYQDPVKEELTVTLSREDGTLWTFKGDETYSVADAKYFNVENSAYGISNCIIFRPDNVETYEGVYRVTVQGLKDPEGNPAELVYEVDFFNTEDYITNDTHICTIKRFQDVKHPSWYHNAVQYAVDNGLMNGTGTTKFEPNAMLTRAMIVQVLYNREGKPAAPANPFTDVAANKWYTNAVAWSAANAIVKGFEDSTFRPEVPITRQQMATILFRYAEYKGYDTTPRGDLSAFTDGAQTSGWAKNAVEWAVATGLMQGDEKGNFDPQGTATRAQVATVLMNYCEKIAK